MLFRSVAAPSDGVTLGIWALPGRSRAKVKKTAMVVCFKQFMCSLSLRQLLISSRLAARLRSTIRQCAVGMDEAGNYSRAIPIRSTLAEDDSIKNYVNSNSTADHFALESSQPHRS